VYSRFLICEAKRNCEFGPDTRPAFSYSTTAMPAKRQKESANDAGRSGCSAGLKRQSAASLLQELGPESDCLSLGMSAVVQTNRVGLCWRRTTARRIDCLCFSERETRRFRSAKHAGPLELMSDQVRSCPRRLSLDSENSTNHCSPPARTG